MPALMAIFIALALQAVPAQVQASSPARQAFERAEAHFARNENEEALAAYDEAIALGPARAEYYAGRGRTLARLRRYDETFAAFAQALRLAPGDPRLLRDRGHYYINVRKLDLAISDLERAESLDKDDFGIYYHLALAYYLTGDFTKAAETYEACVRTAASDDDRVACYAWQYPSLVRAGREADAKALLARITPSLDVKENTSYLDRLLLFKGVRTEAEVVAEMDVSPLNRSTVGYGVGLWHLLNGRTDLARAYFEKASSGDYWPAFGYVAAEIELKRMR